MNITIPILTLSTVIVLTLNNRHHADIINLAVEQFQNLGPLLHTSDNISPNTQQQNQDDELAGLTEDPDFAVLNPDNTILCQIQHQ